MIASSPVKKLVLTAAIVLVFAGYSFYIRRTSSQTPTDIITAAPTKSGSSATTAVPSEAGNPSAPSPSAQFKDGQYTGNEVFAFYGNVQVKATISGGKLTDVQFLQYPSDRNRSIMINTFAMPQLRSQAIQAQNSQVDGVSGATDTSDAFRESLSSALSQAHI